MEMSVPDRSGGFCKIGGGGQKSMGVNARPATAADFDPAAQQKANSFWFWLVVAGIVYYFFKYWAIIPGALAVLSAIQSISATRAASSLRNGTYRLPNPNNGAPDGDARNFE
jgi:hypothetical protein